MPNRYFIADPRVTGLAQFLAGFGQRRQQVADVNVATQTQQNRLLGRGMGDVVGGFFEQQTADRRFNMQQMAQAQKVAQAQQNRMAAQQAYEQGRINLENVRSANDIYEYERAAFVETWGGPPEALFEQMNLGGAPGQGAPQAGPAPDQAQAPPRSNKPADPSQLQEFRRTQDSIQSLKKAAQEARMLPSKREQSERLMTILPELIRAESQLRAMEEKPQTYAEKVQGGTTMHNGVLWYPDKDGVDKPFMPPKSITEAPPWTGIEDPIVRQEAQNQHFATHHRVEPDGSEFLWQGGQWERLKSNEKTPGELYDEAYKLLSTGKMLPPKHEKVLSYMADRDRFIQEQERKPAHDALIRRSTELLEMSARGEVHPAMLAKWAKNAVATYGTNDVTQWPKDMQEMARKLDTVYNLLTQSLVVPPQ